MAIWTCNRCKKELECPVPFVMEKLIFAHMVAHEVSEMIASEMTMKIDIKKEVDGLTRPWGIENKTKHKLKLSMDATANEKDKITIYCGCEKCAESGQVEPAKSVPSLTESNFSAAPENQTTNGDEEKWEKS